MHVDLFTPRRVFRGAHYTELSSHCTWRIPQRSSWGWTYSRSTLWKSLRATNNDSFRSAIDRDHTSKYRQQFDALIFSHRLLRFYLSMSEETPRMAIHEKALPRSSPGKRYKEIILRDNFESCDNQDRNPLVRYYFRNLHVIVFNKWRNSLPLSSILKELNSKNIK